MADPHFVGILKLDTNPSDPNTLVVTSHSFGFVDRKGLRWDAPFGSIVGGAHIPSLLKPIIGYAYEEPELKAATLHDVYCTNMLRTWQATDAMFESALVTSGVNIVKARTMWAAVYGYHLFGAGWPKPT